VANVVEVLLSVSKLIKCGNRHERGSYGWQQYSDPGMGLLYMMVRVYNGLGIWEETYKLSFGPGGVN